jgi:hypothetical protein
MALVQFIVSLFVFFDFFLNLVIIRKERRPLKRVFLIEKNMEKNTINKIKEKEEEIRTLISKTKENLEGERTKKEEDLKENEKSLIEEYENRTNLLKNELEKDFQEINQRLEKKHEEKKTNLLKNSKDNLERFKEEVLKRA